MRAVWTRAVRAEECFRPGLPGGGARLALLVALWVVSACGPVDVGQLGARIAPGDTWFHHGEGAPRPVEHGGVVRRALVVEPGRDAQLEVGQLGVDGLALIFGPAPGAPADVDAVLALDIDDGVERRELWAASLEPGSEGWMGARVDLSAWSNGPVSLWLRAQGHDVAVARLVFEGPPRSLPPRPSVVLIQVDGLRADRLGSYGAATSAAPGLDAWTLGGVTVFTDALAASGSPESALGPLFTGRRDHGSVPTLPERLSAAGYECWAASEAPTAAESSLSDRLAQGTDVWDRRATAAPEWGQLLAGLDERQSERPLFLWLRTTVLLRGLPATPPDAMPALGADAPGPERGQANAAAARQALADLYDDRVRRLDQTLAGVLDQLDHHFARRDMLVVVTAGVGCALLEHGQVGAHSLHREVLAVPMLMRFPTGSHPEGAHVGQPVTALDLVPTILDQVGLLGTDKLDGRSLSYRPRDWRVRVAQLQDVSAVAYDGFKLIVGRQPDGRAVRHLYDLAVDPRELRDIADRAPAKVSALERRLTAALTPKDD